MKKNLLTVSLWGIYLLFLSCRPVSNRPVSYTHLFRLYRLAYPNGEVRYGFTESLLPGYVHRFPRENTFYAVSFIRDLQQGDIDSCPVSYTHLDVYKRQV